MNRTTRLILAAVALTGAAVMLALGQYIIAAVAALAAAALVFIGRAK